ncbi:MBL fold metallo-hydrolase [Nocardiopsis mangrovi]|uniref:MBL fold metallo-hydrolase n=1 Tax=Nocardiopsis mangrovi TaxID=1179818 RepID=A0ABV9DYR6_9ACTN
MRLTVLGSATPYPRPDDPCSGHLVRHGTTTVWLDAGPGTLAELQRHTAIDALDAIWISHLHADHSSDLLTAFYALLYADLRPAAPIPLFGPPGTADRLRHYLTNTEPGPVERAFDVHELHDGHECAVGGLRLRSRLVEHGFPAFGVRVDAGAVSLAYSGDTAPCPALDDLAAGADTLLCEADGDAPPAGVPRVHMTPEDAGAVARKAGVRRLILTHVAPPLRAGAAVERAAAAFGGAVEHAAPGRTFGVGPDTS